MGGALLLWVGFALLVAVLLIIAIPFSIWSIFARRRAAKNWSVTIEGTATRVPEKVVLEPPAADQSTRSDAPRDS